MKKILLATTAIMLSQGASAATDLPSSEEMWKMIQAQQKQIEALTGKLAVNEEKIVQTEVKIEEAKEEVVKNIANLESSSGALGWWNKTSIGGYGEIHMNKGATKDEVDFHRFVTFIGHEFNDDIRLFAEIEVEHADEIFLEQAYLEFDINDYNIARVGAFIVPVGIMSERHEPTTFFGVERNPIETNIIPSTWREAGVAFSGELGEGFGYDVAVHSGLNVPITGGNNFRIRSGRGKVSNQAAEDGAVTGRVRYSGVPGLKLAAALQYQQDLTQGNGTESASATLFEADADYRNGPWGLRALYAQWNINGADAEAIGRDEQFGFYIEPSYRFPIFEESEAGVFARYNYYDTDDVAAGNTANSEIEQIDFGVNFWPHPDVVLKADMALIRSEITQDDEIFNLGAGFMF